jgi:CHAT domain-containing protein
VPFGVLPKPDPRRPGFTEEPLLTQHELVVVPSTAVLALQRRALATRPPAPLKLAILADPVYRAGDPRLDGLVEPHPDRPPAAGITRGLRGLDLDDLDRLDYSRQEALALAELVDADQRLVALDFDASRDLVLSGTLGRFQMVHLAGHGFLNTVHPSLSGVVLSLFDKRGHPRDGFLRAHELRELDLSADLVVFSACKTALGPQLAGEGVLGVTRGLLLGGARRAVVSHWNVDDRATAELMERFYTAMLRDGVPAPAALRQAELSMAADPKWSAPSHWSAFALHGDWR